METTFAPIDIMEVLQKRNLLEVFLAEISTDRKLKLLAGAGFEEATSVAGKQSRRDNYLKSKMPVLRKQIFEYPIADIALVYWGAEISGNEDLFLHIYQPDGMKKNTGRDDSGVSDTLSAFDMGFAYLNLLKGFQESEALWKGYLVSSAVLTQEFFTLKNMEEMRGSFIQHFNELHLPFLLKIRGELEEYLEKFVHPDTLEPRINELEQMFAITGEKFLLAGRSIKEDGLLPPKEILEDIGSIYKKFKTTSELTQQALRFYDLKGGDKPFRSFQEILLGFQEIKKEYQSRRSEQHVLDSVIPFYNEALRIESKSSEDADVIAAFKNLVSAELSRITEDSSSDESERRIKAILEGTHPLTGILRIISGAKLSFEEILKISQSISAEYGDTIAGLAIQKFLYLSPAAVDQKEATTASASTVSLESQVPGAASVIGKTSEHIFDKSEISADTTDKSKIDVRVGEGGFDSPDVGKSEMESERKELELSSQPDTESSISVPDPDDGDGIQLKEKYEEIPDTAVFSPEYSSADIAGILVEENDSEWSMKYEDLIRSLLIEDKISHAYWFSRFFEDTGRGTPVLKSEIIESAGIAPVMSSDVDIWVDRLRNNFALLQPRILRVMEGPGNPGYDLALFAATLLPVLIAPRSEALDIFEMIRLLPETLREMQRKIVEFAGKGHQIIPHLLHEHLSSDSWWKSLQELKGEIETWRSEAKSKAVVFQPAADVWNRWMQPRGYVHNLLQPALTDDASRKDQVKQLVSYLRLPANIRREVEKTDEKLRGRGRQQITGRALDQLERAIEKTLDYAIRWIKLHDQKPDGELDWRIQETRTMFDVICGNYLSAQKELEELLKGNPERKLVRAGSKLALRTLDTVVKLFQSPDYGKREELTELSRTRRQIFSTILLKIPQVELNDEWDPTGMGDESFLFPLLRSLYDPEKSLVEIFNLQMERKNHKATRWIIEQMDIEGDDLEAERLLEERSKHLELCQATLAKKVTETVNYIENAVLQDILTEMDRRELLGKVEAIDVRNVLDFQPVYKTLNSARAIVDEIRDDIIRRARRLLEKYRDKVEDEDYQRIIDALERGDISTANEYIAMIAQGEPIRVKMEEEDTFQVFFPRQMVAIEQHLERYANFVIDDLKKVDDLRTIGPVNLRDIPGAQRMEAARAMESWYSLKTKRRVEQEDFTKVSDIFTYLGFIPRGDFIKEANGERWGMPAWFRMQVTVPRCPIPAFGSVTGGEYMVLCTWDRPSEEEILDMTHRFSNRAVIVIYFARLTEMRRRDLAKLARKQKRTITVIDESLMLFLTRERGSRLESFFKCTLPFSWTNPFTPFAAGEVPPEMFYGRRDAVLDIWDRDGSCFIYGGRQLGKSALLRHVQRSYHNPEYGNIVINVDLKAEGIGETRRIQDLWSLLAKRFKDEGIIPENVPYTISYETMFNHLSSWLNEDANRRVLLLLDESDSFLNQDAKQKFAITEVLRDRMNSSRRRFKIVFAGLHNVQRFQNIPNQPLAHFGSPISIGPLEPRDAVELIRRPFEAMGYRFETRDLIIRILSHTNYQPSLLQLFGDELIRHLSAIEFDQKVSPPYIITERHVDETYRNQNLRQKIRERFEWTLSLDHRYKVIAYCAANKYLSKQEREDTDFDIHWLLREAPYWWASGFKNITFDEMRSLADEMVGLGVLIKKTDGQYNLRSPNVLRLLGTVEEIQQHLLEAERLPPPVTFDANTFRQKLANNTLSPLTLLQESDMLKSENGVRLIIGNRALGNLESIKEVLTRSLGESSVQILMGNSGETTEVILEALNRKEKDYRVFLLASSTLENTPEFIQEITGLLRKLYAPERATKIGIYFDQDDLYQWFKLPVSYRELLETEAPPMVLKLWSESCLQRWLDDQGIPNVLRQMPSFIAHTGGWPQLIHATTRMIKEQYKSIDEALSMLSSQLANPREDLFREFRQACNIDIWDTAVEILRVLKELEEACLASEIGSLFENTDSDEIENALEYLKMVSLVNTTHDGKIIAEQIAISVLFKEVSL